MIVAPSSLDDCSINTATPGYPVEAEILSVRTWWRRPISETLAVCARRFWAAY